MDLITSLTSQVMSKALDGLSKRHKAIASNLANVDTPGYRRRDVSFEGALGQALQKAKGQEASQQNMPASNDIPLSMKTSRPEHFGLQIGSVDEVEPQMVESEDVSFRNDGNAVDVETEMVQLAKNTERYLAVSNMQSRDIKSLRSIIQGGGS